ncbi:MAG: TIGR03960 family B12-binding radical SAM protein [Deltaproteobacteria bacterium]|nr:TIGR03960 family B12-binding radical SAM protein [Deltaproteobacteria bacterium]
MSTDPSILNDKGILSDIGVLTDLDLLKDIEHPARYLGNEPGANPNRLPDQKGRLLTIALAFPDVYEIAHSHLGHKILYHMINSVPGLSAERVYAPWVDLEERLRGKNLPLKSLESSIALKSFDVVGFSLQYELGYTNIINMLSLGRINPLADQRDKDAPLITAGGPGASNPEPLARFFDVFFLGDAEASFIEDLQIVKEWRCRKAPKDELYERLMGRAGIYIPSLFKPVYRHGRLIAVEPLKKTYGKVVRAVSAKLTETPFPSCQITPFIKPVHDRVVVEIGRGCSRGCRFCQAGFIYRPVRERPGKEVLELISQNLKATGQSEAALLSLSAGDHTQIEAIVTDFMDRYEPHSVSLSLPSLRVGSLSENLAKQIKRVRKTGFTIAPEAATERLRAVINKDLAEEDIFKAAKIAFSLGWRTLKLYFMCGLPTETRQDLEAIVTLTQKLKRLSRAKINLGLAHFTPKAHTPFQWHGASDVEQIRERLSIVRKAAASPGLAVRFNDPGASFVEALIARGDRRIGALIEQVHQRGARFEAWNEHFRLNYWLEAINDLELDLDELLRPKELDECLPWDHLFCGVDRRYLIKELSLALSAQPTSDCRKVGCLGCGACHDDAQVCLAAASSSDGGLTCQAPSPDALSAESDSPASADVGKKEDIDKPSENLASRPESETAEAETAKTETAKTETVKTETTKTASSRSSFKRESIKPDFGEAKAKPKSPSPVETRYLARFSKQGRLALLGHLELVELFKRAFRRAQLDLVMSQGFHPQPKLSFLTALPVGVESLDECLLFSLPFSAESPESICRKLSLPDGLRLTSVPIELSIGQKPRAVAADWVVSSGSEVFQTPPLHLDAHLSYTDKKGSTKKFILKDFVRQASSIDRHKAHLTISIGESGTPKPLAVARTLWGLEPDFPLIATKTATILSK